LWASNVIAVSLSGQIAGKNLDSSEQFALGGPNGVRAYPQGEGIGDEGYLANLELRHGLTNNLQALLFYDVGSTTVNRDVFGPPSANTRNLAGAGVGLRATVKQVQLKLSLAWRTTGGLPTSIPPGAVHTPTGLVEAILNF
jgi:hemolysin activation/secretion protein